jgi:hypothetical protein
MIQQQIPVEIITEVFKCVSSIGTEQTMHRLRLMSMKDGRSEKISDIIINAICDRISISKRALLSGHQYGKRTDAMMYLFILHKVHLGYDYEEVGNLFSKRYHTVRNRMKAFEKLDPDHSYDEVVLRTYNEINEQVKQCIEQI